MNAALGTVLVRKGRYREALPLLRAALPIVEKQFGPNDRRVVAARAALAKVPERFAVPDTGRGAPAKRQVSRR